MERKLSSQSSSADDSSITSLDMHSNSVVTEPTSGPVTEVEAGPSVSSMPQQRSEGFCGRVVDNENVFGELTVKAISSAFILVAKSLQTQVVTDAMASSCRASACIVESRALADALAASLRMAADSVENEKLMDSVANSLTVTANALDQDAVHSLVDRGYRIGVAALRKSLLLTSAALENETVQKTMGYVVQVSESESVQKITQTGAVAADAALRSNIVRTTVSGGKSFVRAASESSLLQRSVQKVGGLIAQVASNETVQSTAGSATDIVFKAVRSERVQALSKPVQSIGTKSVEIVTSDQVQHAASRLWNLVLSAEQLVQGLRDGDTCPELQALAEAVSKRADLEVTAESFQASLRQHDVVRDALLAEALQIRRAAALDQRRYEEREQAFLEEIERMRARQTAMTDRLAELAKTS